MLAAMSRHPNKEEIGESFNVELQEIIYPNTEIMDNNIEETGIDLNPDEECIKNEKQVNSNTNLYEYPETVEISKDLDISFNPESFKQTSFPESNGDVINVSVLPNRRPPATSRISRASITSWAIPPPPLDESMCQVFFHILIPFLIAGCGTVGAGKVLDLVQYWTVYLKVGEILILVPALSGLKGNLEMCLASRLSTHAHLGTLDLPKERWRVISGNLALEQCQSTVVGFFAAIVALAMTGIFHRQFDIRHALLLCASSVAAASSTSLVLGSLMCTVVVVSRKLKINPDNIATPIAASVGDLITLAILSGYSTLIYNTMETFFWLPVILMGIYSILMPLWIILTRRNKYVSSILHTGWIPVIVAMLISSVSGLILNHAITVIGLNSMAAYQPIINGIGGNLVAVQSSRLATGLHRDTEPGYMPGNHPNICISPIKAFFSKEIHSQTARVLILMSIPGQVIFLFTISALSGEFYSLTVLFGFLYISAATLQVIILLYVAVILVHLLWHFKSDPDTSSIPYLTALGDLLGTSLLFCVFLIKIQVDKSTSSGPDGT